MKRLSGRCYAICRGFQIQGAASGKEALALPAGEDFNLLLSDVRMPGITGVGLLSEFRRRHGGVRVLMLTDCKDVSLAVKAMKTEAQDSVLKPFSSGKCGGERPPVEAVN